MSAAATEHVGAAAGAAILEMRHICKTFGSSRALDDVMLELRQGEVHAICGENGAGKSTLMNVLSGVLPYGSYEGEVLLDGHPCAFRSVRDSEAAGIAIVHQELALVPTLSVAENIFMGNEIARHGIVDWDATMETAAGLLAKVGLNVHPSTCVSELGIGQQQLVEIAKALIKDVRLLILDEPTAALNDTDSAHLIKLMRELRERGTALALISHKLAEVMSVADRVTVLRDGKTVGCAPLHGPGALDEEGIIRLMVGRELKSRYPEREPHIGEEALRISDWTVYHPADSTRKVVDGAALTLRHGEIVGLAGLMGAGRTELATSVFGRFWGAGISGHIYKNGREVTLASVREAIEAGIAYVTEDRLALGLNMIAGVKPNTTTVALNKVAPRGIVDSAAETEVAAHYQSELHTKTSSLTAPVSALSGGNQQKVVLSKWMFSDADVLILDEPTRGIDIGAKYDLYQVICDLANAGAAILVISSELSELLGLCDRIYTMCEGRITGELARSEADQEKLMRLMTSQAGLSKRNQPGAYEGTQA